MDASFLDDIIRSRRLTEQQRAWETLQLIDRTRELMVAGIRMQHPDANDEQVQALLRHRYAMARRVELM